MNYRKILYSIPILVVLLVLWWIVSTGLYLSSAPRDDYDRLGILTSTMQGYNYMKAQVLFSAIFVIILFAWQTESSELYLIRDSRLHCVIRKIAGMGLSAVLYATLFVIVEVVINTGVMRYQFLDQYNYYISAAIYWSALVLLYWFTGSIYYLCSMFTKSYLKAVAITFVISVVIMACALYRSIPTIYLAMDILQISISGNANIYSYILSIKWNIPVMLIMWYCSYILFSKKDILSNETPNIF